VNDINNVIRDLKADNDTNKEDICIFKTDNDYNKTKIEEVKQKIEELQTCADET
jgi:hypothetical protein